MGIHLHLHEHIYPAIMWRYPRLARFAHGWNNLILQRNWAVNDHLKKLFPNLPTGCIVVDAGCGSGQHIFPFFKKFPHIRFWGFDKNQHNIAFCEKYSQAVAAREQLMFFHQTLENMALQNEVELLLCIGTLQYIADDKLVLENFYRALKPHGKFLFYTPVNGRAVLPFYNYFFEKLGHYEKSQGRERVYAPAEIRGKLNAAGFKILKQQPTYGTLGIAAHETYSLLLMGLGNAAWWWAWVFVPLLILCLPLILVFKGIDSILPKKNGNGLLIVASKLG